MEGYPEVLVEFRVIYKDSEVSHNLFVYYIPETTTQSRSYFILQL